MRKLLIAGALLGATTAHAQRYATIDTPALDRTSEQPTIVMYQNAPHIFVSDRDLGTNRTRLEWCQPGFGTTCTWTVIDGAADDLAIPAGSMIKPVVWSGGDQRLHLFYIHRGSSGWGVLRHAVHTTSGWFVENLDGAGGASGQIFANIGGVQIGALDFAPYLYVSYYDASNTNLRIARLSPKTGWTFSTIDGDGATLGRINGHVGINSTLVALGGYVHALYSDATTSDLRHARLGSRGWAYETIDGNGSPTSLPTSDYVISPIATVVSGGWLHIMYNHPAWGGITHAWTSGGAWGYAHHDGNAGALAVTSGGGCTEGDVMYFPYGIGSDSDLKVTSSVASSPWDYVVWDGHVNDGWGRIAAPVGKYSACVAATSRLFIVYTHELGGGRQAIRYAVTDPPV